MIRKTVIIALIFVQTIFGQDKVIAKDSILIHLVNYNFGTQNTKYKEVFQFDSKGTIHNKKRYGIINPSDNKKSDNVSTYTYNPNGLLINLTAQQYTKGVETHCKWETKYTYNEKQLLVDESQYFVGDNSLKYNLGYEYDSKNNIIKIVHSPTQYDVYSYDEENKLVLIKYYWQSDLENKNIIIKDIVQPKLERLQVYKDAVLQRVEEKKDDKVTVFRKFYYSKNGILHKIRTYGNLGLERETIVKFDKKTNLTKEVISKINEVIRFNSIY